MIEIIRLAQLDGAFSDLPLSERQTKAGRILLSRMIKEQYGKTDFTITYNENGKPLLDFCFFSISHSGDLVICAVSDKPIGIDMERKKPIKKRKTYLLFSENESRYVNHSDDISLAFLTVWTRKEAMIKALGGKLTDMANFSLANDDLTLKTDYKGFTLKTEFLENALISTAE